MDTNEEIKQQETLPEPPEETVGDIMRNMTTDGLKWLVIIGGIAVYLTAIVYAEVHGLTMLQKGVAPDMRIWAQAGMIAAGVSAVLFPLALKVWAIEARHRLTCALFYVVDFAFLAFNAFTDFNTNAGQQLAPWAQSYVTYILPSSPVIVGAMWAILFQLDPAVRAAILKLTLRAAMREKMARKVADAAKGAKVTATVNAAAEREVERALTELFGAPVYRIDNTGATSDTPQLKGLLQSFFGYLLQRVQRVSSPGTRSQSNPSASPEPPDQDAPNP
jgi:hypothetical protein